MVDFNCMLFLLSGLGLIQYFSEALTWFWENSLLIKYSGKLLSRDLLIYLCKPHVALPTELSFLVIIYKMGNTFSHSALLVTAALAPLHPVTAWRMLRPDRSCWGPGFLPCLLCDPQSFT